MTLEYFSQPLAIQAPLFSEQQGSDKHQATLCTENSIFSFVFHPYPLTMDPAFVAVQLQTADTGSICMGFDTFGIETGSSNGMKGT